MKTKQKLSQQDEDDMGSYLVVSTPYEVTEESMDERHYFDQPCTGTHPHPIQIWLNAINFAWRIKGLGVDPHRAAPLVMIAYSHYDETAKEMLMLCVDFILFDHVTLDMLGIDNIDFVKDQIYYICKRWESEQDPCYLEDLDDPSGQYDGFSIDVEKGTVTLGKDEDMHRVTVRVLKLMHLKQIYEFTSKELKF